jgi:hypothetical protein
MSAQPKNRAGRVLLARALEPRFLLDGAALATAVEAVPEPVDTPDAAVDVTETEQALIDALAPAAANSEGDSVRSATQIVFIDSAVAEYEALIAGLPEGVEVVTLDQSKDGVNQIADTLYGRTGITAIHIVTHGDDGAAMLGGAELSSDTLAAYAETITGWGASLTVDADILFYGCDMAAGPDGRAFVAALATLTGADIAASTDATGAEARGGDWDLEHTTGAIEADVAFDADTRAAWDHLLAPPSAGGDVAAQNPAGGGAISIAEDSGATLIRLTPTTLSDADGPTDPPNQVRIISVTGGTLTQSGGGAITLGASGTILTLTGGSLDMQFTADANRATDATVQYVVVGGDGENSVASTMTIDITPVNDQVNGGGDATATQTDGSALSVTEDAGATAIQLTVPTLSDPDGSTPTQIRIISVTGGTLTQSGGAAITLGASGTLLTLSNINSGSANQINLLFTPDANRDTNASFTYVVVDPAATNRLSRPYLASRYGSGVEVRTAADGALTPETPVYRIVMRPAGVAAAPDRVIRGAVVLDGPPRSFAERAWQAVSASAEIDLKYKVGRTPWL